MRMGVLAGLAASLVVSVSMNAAAAAPATVAFVGDSMADGLWGAFFRLTGNQKCSPEELALMRDAKNGTGLARPDHFDWSSELDQIVTKSAPTVMFASLGLNDEQDMILPDKTKYRLGSPEWMAQYTKNVDAFYEHAGAGGAAVMIVGLPNLRDKSADQHAQLVNTIFQMEAANDKKVSVTYVPPWTLTNPDGSFASFGPSVSGQTVQLRAPDGIHFTQAGYDVLARYLQPSLSKALADAHVKFSNTCLGG
jgi:uncharacterized protein